MKILLKNLFLFLLPIAIMVAIVIFVDPFNYFEISGFFNQSKKDKIANQVNPILRTLIKFKKQPSPYILLGDSRMKNLNTEKVRSIAGEPYYNLAFGGGTIKEICKVFWFASKIIKLKKVYIGINFDLYNSLNNRDLMTKTQSILDNPLFYFTNFNIWESIYYILKSQTDHKDIILSRPDLSKADFWKYQININAKRLFESYVYPYSYFNSLSEIAGYCEKEGVKLYFIVFPTHADLRNKIRDNNLTGYEEKFQKDLFSFSEVLYFDQDNYFSKDSSFFNDPFHYSEFYGEMLICTIWGSANKIIGQWESRSSLKQINYINLDITDRSITASNTHSDNKPINKIESSYIVANDDGKSVGIFTDRVLIPQLGGISAKEKNISYRIRSSKDSLEFINPINGLSMIFVRIK
jgi:hypothetical protein